MQLELFEDRTTGMARARAAFADLELAAAREAFEAVLLGHPGDPDALEGARSVEGLARRLNELEAGAGDSLAALLHLGQELDAALRGGWCRRVARLAEERLGEGCLVEGQPAGLFWLLGGDLVQAERSLAAALVRSPTDGRTRALLGDTLWSSDRGHEARQAYFRAFLDDPSAVDLVFLRDPAVAALPTLAANEYETGGSPASWVAAVGIVEGVFPPPPNLAGIDDPLLRELGGSAEPGLRFVAHLAAERVAGSSDDRIAARRRMKELSPTLLRAYLENLR